MSQSKIAEQLTIGDAEGHVKSQSTDSEVEKDLNKIPKVKSNSKKVSEDLAHKESKNGGKKLAPMLKHYLEIKERYSHHVVLFQVGDFYEIFYDDAKKVASILDIRLTARHKDQPDPVAMCGFPYHSLANYLPKLVKAGLSCVVVSQTEGGSTKKGMVNRAIERVVTPGLRYIEDGLEEKSFNYLASICLGPGGGGVVYIDVSTGHLKLQECESETDILEAFSCLQPAELLVPSTLWDVPIGADWLKRLKGLARASSCKIVERSFARTPKEALEKRVISLLPEEKKNIGAGFEFSSPVTMSAANVLLDFIQDNSFDSEFSLARCSSLDSDRTWVIDAATRKNLEIEASSENNSHSLIQFLDRAKTAFGSRLLAEKLLSPGTDLASIVEYQESVDELFANDELVSELRSSLASVRDLERLSTRIASGRVNPYDLGVLRSSIEVLPRVKELMASCTSDFLAELSSSLDSLDDIFQTLRECIVSEPPTKTTDGGIFENGFNAEIDELRLISRDGKSSLAGFEEQERKKTGISGLKVRYNNVFGYFIEITKANLSRVPESYERKSTLTNSERFVTKELKELEVKILSAKARQISLEKELFVELKQQMAKCRGRLQMSAQILAEIDVVTTAAFVARQYNFVRPILNDLGVTKIVRGRHPVVERLSGSDNFVPNDTLLEVAVGESPKQTFAILTGPNMGGKSTYLRQVGLIQLMAQAGFFVPAESAEIGLVDRIFTRIGASDDLSRGESTFMVEMREAAVIARRASSRSLVLVDELGRGTATSDGRALAHAIVEWLHDRIGCRTIFATHFHELSGLKDTRENIFCLSVGVEEGEEEISFTYRIEQKSASKSYGIEVARLAGLPGELLDRASELLEVGAREMIFDNSLSSKIVTKVVKDERSEKIVESLKDLDLNSLSPIEALNELYRLKDL